MTVPTVNRAGHLSTIALAEQVGDSKSAAVDELLPSPAPVADDDVLVSLAVMMVKSKQDERLANDRAMAAGTQAQQASHARKIELMRELADDTLMEGIVSGALQGAGAIASGVGAVAKFSGEMKELKASELATDVRTADFAGDVAKESKTLARNAGVLDASARGFGATATFAGAIYKSAQERDRSAIAEADAARDAAKAMTDAAASAIGRANEDIRATIAALRQLIAAKSQLANAAIMRG